jgi:hypothetical protein
MRHPHLLAGVLLLAACATHLEPAQPGRAHSLTAVGEAEVRLMEELPSAAEVLWRVRYGTPTPPGRLSERTAVYREQAAGAGANVLVRIITEDGAEEWWALRQARGLSASP